MSVSEQISQLSKEFKEACEAENWDRLKELDLSMRQQLESLVAAAESEEEKQQLEVWLKRVQKIYQLVVRDAERHRAEVASELKQMSKEQKAIASYQRSSRL